MTRSMQKPLTWDGSDWVPNPELPYAGVAIGVTTCTLVASPTSGVSGTTVTLTATVTGSATGSVIFEHLSGSSWLAVATDTTSPWSATYVVTGTTTFRARFLGTATANPSTSASKTFTLNTVTATTTRLTLSPNPVNAGSNAAITAVVSSPVNNGTVQFSFYEDGVWKDYAAPVVPVNGVASWTWTNPDRTLSWRGSYSGSATHGPSASPGDTLTVKTLKTGTKTLDASWSGTYQQSGSKRDVNEVYQGYYSSTNGNQRGLIGFAALGLPAGATVTKVEAYVYAAHWGDSAGGTLALGTHGYTAEPSSYTTGGNQDDVRAAWSSKNGGKWITLPASRNAGFASGALRGVIIGPGPSTSTLSYYGYFNGAAQSNNPQLRVSYQYYS